MVHPLDILLYEAYLNEKSPGCLHGDGDETGDGICQGEVENKVVNICPASDGRPGGMLAGRHQGDRVQ